MVTSPFRSRASSIAGGRREIATTTASNTTTASPSIRSPMIMQPLCGGGVTATGMVSVRRADQGKRAGRGLLPGFRRGAEVREQERVQRVGRLFGDPMAHALEDLEPVRPFDVLRRRLRRLATQGRVIGAPH